MWNFSMKLAQFNDYFVYIVGYDGLVILQQAISVDNVECTPMFFQLFKG